MAHTFNDNDIEAVIHRDSGKEVAGGGGDGATPLPEPRLGYELEYGLSPTLNSEERYA